MDETSNTIARGDRREVQEEDAEDTRTLRIREGECQVG
jgi:hypothetical protein